MTPQSWVTVMGHSHVPGLKRALPRRGSQLGCGSWSLRLLCELRPPTRRLWTRPKVLTVTPTAVCPSSGQLNVQGTDPGRET